MVDWPKPSRFDVAAHRKTRDMTTPNVLYAVAADFAGAGIGRTAYRAALGLDRAGMLARVACLSARPCEIEPARIDAYPFLPDAARRVAGDKLYYEAKNRAFDARLMRAIGRAEGLTSIHVWNSQATGAIAEAKRRGLGVVVDRASTHIRTQSRILRDAYARHGIRYEPTHDRVVARCLRDYDLADLVTVPSPFAHDSFLAEGFDPARLVLNPFGANLNVVAPPIAARPGPFTVLFVGQIGVRKGVPELLAAWERAALPDARLVLAGGIEPMSRRIIDPDRPRPGVTFAGFVADVGALMRTAHVFAFPSIEEGSALVTYEAMAHGLPMIVTPNAGSVARADEDALFVPPGDIDALADALRRLHDDADLRDRLLRSARARVEQFPWAAYGERTAETHQRLA
ncbi:MAG: glycosyltransferase family 4 protein [Deltaproteobacteria bacterium]|nr:glycosyltransferase family 4 protein [Deltaproteobacteria bacterium]